MVAPLALTLGGYLGQAITQDGVTRGVSYMVARHQERASMGDSYEERIKLAHSEMQFVLERSGKLPIADVSLLNKRMMIKLAFQECDTLLRSLQPPVHDQQAQQMAIAEAEATATPPAAEATATQAAEATATQAAEVAATATEAAAAAVLGEVAAAAQVLGKVAAAGEFLCSSLVRSVSSALGITRDKQSLRIDDVKKFEGYADFAGKFMRDVESGCSIAHYRFFSPLITQLLQGITLHYKMVQASRAQHLCIDPVRTEDHGVIAKFTFCSFDAQIPTKCFEVVLYIRLSENTNIVGTGIQCLESLRPQFKSLAQVAMGELSQLPTQDLSDTCLSDIDNRAMTSCLYLARPDPLCCQANMLQTACADNVIPSQLESHRFPEQLVAMLFKCEVSAFDQYNVQSSADDAERNVVNGWPLLKVQTMFFPHCPGGDEIRGWQTIGEQREYMNGTSVQQMGEMVLTNAITCFIRQPELTEYRLDWVSPHGAAGFVVERPLTDLQFLELFERSVDLGYFLLSEDA